MKKNAEYEQAIAGDRSVREELLDECYVGLEIKVVNQWLEDAIADKDSGIVFSIADWFMAVKKDCKKYLDVAKIASDMGNEYASYRLGEAYREGKICDCEFDKALGFYRKAEQQGYDYEGVNPLCPNAEPIDYCKRNLGVDDGFTLDWWLFVLERNPTSALKYSLGEWYWHPFENCAWTTSGQENKERALELLESAAADGFDAAILQLLEIYSCDARFKNIKKAQELFRRAEELKVDDVEFYAAVEGYAAELGIVSNRIKELEIAVLEKRDLRASAELAIAYLDGNGCPKDKGKAFRYAKELLFEDDDFGLMGSIADRANSSLDAKEIWIKLNDTANEVEKNVGGDYEELAKWTRGTRVPTDGWMFPNGHDDGEAPDTGTLGR